MPAPVPGDREVLVRVRAATVGIVDTLARRGSPVYARVGFGLRRPRYPVLGSTFAGEVAAVGPGVTRFVVGDRVFGLTSPRFGAHAEFVCLPDSAPLVATPGNLDHAAAAALADNTSPYFLRDLTQLKAGQRILIIGASGSVGSAALQIARHLGATVTAVCGPAHADLVRRLGAEAVVDHTREDFCAAGPTYDVIFDVAGRGSFSRCRRVLAADGTYLTTAPSPAIFLRMAWTSRVGRRRAVVGFAGLRPADEKRSALDWLAGLAEAGAMVPVIEAQYPIERIAEAHRHVEAGKAGNIVALF
jgi:NADPH:quinone reductase-like Zn-dependent oxidoreductase